MKKSRTLTIAIWIVFMTLCGLVVSHSKFTADLSAFLPANPSATQQLFVDQLQNGIASRLILAGIEGADKKTRAVLSKTIAQKLRSIPEFISVGNGEQIGTEHDRKFLFSKRYLLSPAITPEHFSTTGLHDAISNSIDMLASPLGLMIKPLLMRDPTGEMIQLLSGLNSGTRPRIYDGVWMSADGNRAILLIQTAADGSNIDAQQRAIALIHDAFNQAINSNSSPATLKLTGPGVFSVSSRDTIRQEVTNLSIISTVIIMTLLLVVYRSIIPVVIGALPIATGILAGIAAVSLGFGVVHGVTLGFGITLIGEAIDYSIYLFIQSQSNNIDQKQQVNWLKNFWPTIRLGVATSVIGFASLLFSGFPGLAQLGLYSTSGLIVAALVTRFVLPSFLSQNFRIRDISRAGNLLRYFSNYSIPSRWITAILAIMSCAVIYGHRHSIWNSDLAALSPVSAENRAMDAQLRQDLNAPDPRYLVAVSADTMDGTLASAEKVSVILDKLVNDGVLTGYDSPSHYLPSQGMQDKRKNAIPERGVLTSRLQEALADLPVRTSILEGFLDDAETARTSPALQRSDLTDTSFALALDALLVRHDNSWSALLPLRIPAEKNTGVPVDLERVRKDINNSGINSASFIDVKRELNGMYTRYLENAIRLSLTGLVAIILLLFFSLRSVNRTLRVVLPLGLAILTVSAGLISCGIQLTILHLVGMLLIAAIGSNYALFFDKRSFEDTSEDNSRTLASSLFANVTTVTVFGLLALSNVPVLENIGMTVAPGVILALLFSVILAALPGTDISHNIKK